MCDRDKLIEERLRARESELQSEYDKSLAERIKAQKEELETEHERTLKEKMESVDKMWSQQMSRREEELEKEHNQRMHMLRKEFQMSGSTIGESGQGCLQVETISIEKHSELLAEAEREVKDRLEKRFEVSCLIIYA